MNLLIFLNTYEFFQKFYNLKSFLGYSYVTVHSIIRKVLENNVESYFENISKIREH